uniref:Bowman-Birk serine protease inhibitors family domain-containing protein n=1 Tax=Aegilops tauschii subsp. strangulata TaxID=200361 RepID=A0A452Z634_AEGTS
MPIQLTRRLTDLIPCVRAAEFPKCCDNCRFFSGAVVCDDAGPKCRDGCVNCRVVQTSPKKTFRCADARADDGTPCKPCKKH